MTEALLVTNIPVVLCLGGHKGGASCEKVPTGDRADHSFHNHRGCHSWAPPWLRAAQDFSVSVWYGPEKSCPTWLKMPSLGKVTHSRILVPVSGTGICILSEGNV